MDTETENPDRCCIDLSDILKTLEPDKSKDVSTGRLDQYKRHHAVPSQDERRKQFLQALKDRRKDFVAHARHLALGEEDDDDEVEQMDSSTTYRKRGSKKNRTDFRNQLMLSEWLVQLPPDLETDWLLVPCPVGKRCLVIASRGRTRAYSRTGHLLSNFSSLLPGGSRRTDRSTYTILDCLYCKADRLLYVLDIMCWQGHPVYDCDTVFRFYWLKTKLAETPGLMSTSDLNYNRLLGLECHPCDQATVQKVLREPLLFPLDGLLFYCKSSLYTQGVSPLVCWLKAYMVPELMSSISVPESLCADKPIDYVSMEQYLVKAFTRLPQMECE